MKRSIRTPGRAASPARRTRRPSGRYRASVVRTYTGPIAAARASILVVALAVAAAVPACSADEVSGQKTTPTQGSTVPIQLQNRAPLASPGDTQLPVPAHVEVIAEHPHDTAAFTQGLVVGPDGTFWESTGRYGHSSLRIVELDTGKVRKKVSVSDDIFAEGLALVGDRLIQITWKEGVAITYDATTLEEVGRFEYDGEGWGLCYDGADLVMSDGSDRLAFRDPVTFEVRKHLAVTESSKPVRDINELECANGRVYANQWHTDRILEIDPATGEVTAVIDASGLLSPEETQSSDVLNGIAYDDARGVFFLTGKNWPKIFEVVFVA